MQFPVSPRLTAILWWRSHKIFMPKRSAGLLLYRRVSDDFHWEVLLVHPGGPFWRKKDEGAWTIPKGEFDDKEDPLDAARREFTEELGADPPSGTLINLKPVKKA